MKIAVLGLDFPLGKRAIPDERLERLKEIFHTPKVTDIQMEFMDSTHLKEVLGIICEKDSKLDLILGDLEVVESNISNNKNSELFLRCKEALEKEIFLNEVPFDEEERAILLNANLVTLKPTLIVNRENLPSIPEIARSIYTNCGMISFFTVNERELRAWSIKAGTTVHEAAGYIHSDIRRGFIKAEVISYADLIKAGGLNQARSKGLLRLEDKGYVVKDGDLIQIRFSPPTR
ncbi:MAG: DUF933 domain-containing protein [Candidatus Omnitrophica bacterium]|nr:DUF933 domain-containing protein [Candidatus Omnitrophota bacterium]